MLKATSFSGRADSTIKIVDAKVSGRKIVIPSGQNWPDVFRSTTGYSTEFFVFQQQQGVPSPCLSCNLPCIVVESSKKFLSCETLCLTTNSSSNWPATLCYFSTRITIPTAHPSALFPACPRSRLHYLSSSVYKTRVCHSSCGSVESSLEVKFGLAHFRRNISAPFFPTPPVCLIAGCTEDAPNRPKSQRVTTRTGGVAPGITSEDTLNNFFKADESRFLFFLKEKILFRGDGELGGS